MHSYRWNKQRCLWMVFCSLPEQSNYLMSFESELDAIRMVNYLNGGTVLLDELTSVYNEAASDQL